MIGVNGLSLLACAIGLICGLLVLVYVIGKKWWRGHENVWRKRYNSAVEQTLQKEDSNGMQGK
jgi:hypothetical protein